MLFVGIDWAEASHTLCVLDAARQVVASATVPDGSEGLSAIHALVAAHAATPAEVVIGIESDHGLLVGALAAAGYQLYAINPFMVSRYRERSSASGKKSDAGDAKVLADLIRTDRHQHRPLTADSTMATALQLLARSHQRLVWDRQRHANQLRSALRDFYPAALTIFGSALTTPEALALLGRAPTPARGRALSRQQIISLLRHAGRARGVADAAARIQTLLRAPQLEHPTMVADAYGATVSALVAVIAALSAQIQLLERQLTTQFEAHPDAEIIDSLPGLGALLGARVLAEFGDHPQRYADSKARKCYAGTAPITRASGLRRSVLRRHASNTFLTAWCQRWAFCALTASPGARAYYERSRQRGKTHQQALRALANRLVGILHGCLRHRTPYDEALAWPTPTMAQDTAEPHERPDKPSKSAGHPHGSPLSVPASA